MPRYSLLFVSAAVLLAAGPGWRDKPIAEWSNADAEEVLKDSPWIKISQLQNLPDQSPAVRRDSGDWDAGVGKGVGIAGTGILGPRRAEEARERAHAKPDPGTILIRWESALPVHAAEVKTGDTGGPPWQTDYYAIAVYDVPIPPHWNSRELRGIAFLKRFQKKDFKPARVNILRQDDDTVSVVYLFSKSEEITKKDASVTFQAQIGRVFVSQVFDVVEMQFEGQPEL
jgi:hypothetical protein